MALATRVESDSLGEVNVPVDAYWGAQTQRSIDNFPIGLGRYHWGREVVRAFGVIKKNAAIANAQLGKLSPEKEKAIVAAAQEVMDGKWDAHFPLVVFQTGSGTQLNMNANEVIAHRATEILGLPLGSKQGVHPNDDVNRSQSSNDTFPTVMHISIAETIVHQLIPAIEGLSKTFLEKEKAFADVIMLGRTHLQDATPVTLGQVISGWRAQLDEALVSIKNALTWVYDLAQGGTAVGTGLNAPAAFAALVAELIAKDTKLPFVTAPNKFAALSAHDAVVNMSACLRTLAGALMKIANDVRWYASGPRGGIGEINIPFNEPGSSIMPGKINPTQCEALTQVVVQVFGNDHAVAFAGSQGNFQLNVYKPVMVHNVLVSGLLLADATNAFNDHCAKGIEPNQHMIDEHLNHSLMLVTALNPHIGYEKSAKIALYAWHHNTSLKEAALKLGFVTEAEYDAWVKPQEMLHPL